MRRFQCACGKPIFFDNHQCLNCGARVGFDPDSMTMVPLEGRSDLAYCDNHDYGVCNWLRPAASAENRRRRRLRAHPTPPPRHAVRKG